MAELLRFAASVYDVVIIDTTPIGIISDAISLVHQVDGVVVVTRLGHSGRDRARSLMTQLRGLGAHILGLVINESTGGVRYHSHREYGQDAPAPDVEEGAPRRRSERSTSRR